jgi:hypothetical protein
MSLIEFPSRALANPSRSNSRQNAGKAPLPESSSCSIARCRPSFVVRISMRVGTKGGVRSRISAYNVSVTTCGDSPHNASRMRSGNRLGSCGSAPVMTG